MRTGDAPVRAMGLRPRPPTIPFDYVFGTNPMFANPFFISPAPSISDTSGKPALKIMQDVGMNTGNMLFARAVQTILAPQDGPIVRGSANDLRQAHSNHDCIVITAANWLQPRLDFGKQAAAIEESDLPCFVIGLGAQSGSVARIPDLPAGTKRFLSVVSERSKSISVRGEFTAEVLNYHGVQNAEVTGCPSLLMMKSRFPSIQKNSHPPRRISISGSRGTPNDNVLDSPNPTHRLSRLFAKLIQTDGVEFVAQAELPEIFFLLEGSSLDEPVREEWIGFLSKYYNLGEDDLVSLIKRKMKVFFDVDDWIDYLSGRDFIIGTRLHGTIAGLLAGIPSVLIVHDSRTREMANVMAIPMVEADAIHDSIPYDEIYEAADFENFSAGYMKYYAKFRRFFSDNELVCRLT